jgi:hypothetical protein
MFVLKFQAPLSRPSRADRTLLPAVLSALLALMVALQFALPAANPLLSEAGRLVQPRLAAQVAGIAVADPVILQRALFAPGRGGGKAAGVGPLDGAAFVGIVRGRGFARAVLQRPDGQAASIPVGGGYRGWRLVALGQERAVFIRDGVRYAAPIARGVIAVDTGVGTRQVDEQ